MARLRPSLHLRPMSNSSLFFEQNLGASDKAKDDVRQQLIARLHAAAKEIGFDMEQVSGKLVTEKATATNTMPLSLKWGCHLTQAGA